MAYLYLVAFKGQPYGCEDDFNYALRELLTEHCSYCIPAGRTEVFGPSTPGQHLAEICWLLQEVGYTSRSYWELIDQLRDQYEKINVCRPPSWSEVFHSRDASREEHAERLRRLKWWKSNRNWIFRALISNWIKPPKR